MKSRLFTLFGTLGLGIWLFGGAKVPAEEPPGLPDAPPAAGAGPQDGVEVLTRGPVHEAFAEPGARSPRATPVFPKQPPEPIEEMPPDQKPEGDNATWISGYWAWDEDQSDYLWVSGVWRVAPPGRHWTPGYWNQVKDGWQWVPGFWAGADQEQVDYLPPPPDPIAEAVPPPPDDTGIYTPGCWVYRETRYLWRPGFYLTPRLGWVWVPAGYVWTPAGYIFVDGHWDYPLRDRGLLFAPVIVDRRYLGRPGWVYRPAYAVHDEFLQGALFVRLEYGHYYFGDYFDRRYERQGFVPWVDYRVGRGSYDPLYSYYRWNHRDDAHWDRDLRGLYTARVEGQAQRPPRTLTQQTTLIQNFQRTPTNNTTYITNVRNVTAVTPLNQVSRSSFKLQAVPKAQQAEYHQSAVQVRNLSQERRKVDAQLVEKGHAPREEAAPIRVEMPKAKMMVHTSEGVKPPPPLPSFPKPQVHQPAKIDTGHPGDNHPRTNIPLEEHPRVPIAPRDDHPKLGGTPPVPHDEHIKPSTPPHDEHIKPSTPTTINPEHPKSPLPLPVEKPVGPPPKPPADIRHVPEKTVSPPLPPPPALRHVEEKTPVTVPVKPLPPVEIRHVPEKTVTPPSPPPPPPPQPRHVEEKTPTPLPPGSDVKGQGKEKKEKDR